MFTILSALPAATYHAHHLSEIEQHLSSVHLVSLHAKSRVEHDQLYGLSGYRAYSQHSKPASKAHSSRRSSSAELTHPALLVGQRHLPHWLPARECARWQVLKQAHTQCMLAQRCMASTLVPSWDQEHLRRLRSKLCWCPAMTFMQRLAGAKGRRSQTRRELSCQGPLGSACTACALLRTGCCLQ